MPPEPTSELDNEHPWAKYAGTLPEDKLTAEWKLEIALSRIESDRRGAQMAAIARRYPDVYFNYSGVGDPWTDLFGTFRDDPIFEEFKVAIAEYRKRCDEEEAAASRDTAAESNGVEDF